jgi:hypothetical protein
LFRGALTGRDALGDDFRSGQIKSRLWPSPEVRGFGADATVEGLESVPGAERPADGSVGVSDKETREDDADSSLSDAAFDTKAERGTISAERGADLFCGRVRFRGSAKGC